MTVLNHHIVAAHDRDATALFFSEVLGLDSPLGFGPFAVLRVSSDTTLDFVESHDQIHQQHYAFLVSEDEFDRSFGWIRDHQLQHWSDPLRKDPGAINHWDDGRGVYFDDPNGHLLEIITRPYGSGGTQATLTSRAHWCRTSLQPRAVCFMAAASSGASSRNWRNASHRYGNITATAISRTAP